MPKTWSQKARGAKPAHTVILEKSFAGVPAGACLFIPSPPVIEEYMRRVPKGKLAGMAGMRADLARTHGADNTCPVTSSIHSRIVAEIAIEALDAGAPAEAVTPFWRVIDPASALAKKLSIGPAGIERLRMQDA
jgi:hypothetical protein